MRVEVCCRWEEGENAPMKFGNDCERQHYEHGLEGEGVCRPHKKLDAARGGEGSYRKVTC